MCRAMILDGSDRRVPLGPFDIQMVRSGGRAGGYSRQKPMST